MKGYRRLAKDEKWTTMSYFRLFPTAAEQRLRERICWRRIPCGANIRNQAVVLGFVPDFWCPSRRVVIEIDGGYHRDPAKRSEDLRRDAILKRRLGVLTLRFTNEQVLHETDAVVSSIDSTLRSRPVFRSWNEGTKGGASPQVDVIVPVDCKSSARDGNGFGGHKPTVNDVAAARYRAGTMRTSSDQSSPERQPAVRLRIRRLLAER